jgi:hypothetical protein
LPLSPENAPPLPPQAAARLEGLQERLASNLLRRRDELGAAADAASSSPAEAAALEGLRSELARAASAVDDVEARLAEAEARAAAASEASKAAEKEREALSEAARRGGEGGEGARLEALSAKAAAAKQRADDLSRCADGRGVLGAAVGGVHPCVAFGKCPPAICA